MEPVTTQKDPETLGVLLKECSGLECGEGGWRKPGWSRAGRTWCRRTRGWS